MIVKEARGLITL